MSVDSSESGFFRRILGKNLPKWLRYVVKGEKWACRAPKAGKNKPILYITKTRDFKRFCEVNKEKSGILRLPIFGLNEATQFETLFLRIFLLLRNRNFSLLEVVVM